MSSNVLNIFSEFFFIRTVQNNGAIRVIFLVWLLLVVWRLKTEWVQIILTSYVGGYILIYFSHPEAFFFLFFFKCLGFWTQDRKHTDHVLYHWATPIASRNINKQLLFPGTMLDSEDRNWYILVVKGLTVSSDFSETRSPIYFITKNGCPPFFFWAF